MKSGTYSMRLDCAGHSGLGTLVLDGIWAKGSDARYRIEGQLTHSGTHLIAALTIDLTPGIPSDFPIKQLFACSMTGSGGEDSFVLYGIGPLGLIIEIVCQWAGTVGSRGVERRQPASSSEVETE